MNFGQLNPSQVALVKNPDIPEETRSSFNSSMFWVHLNEAGAINSKFFIFILRIAWENLYTPCQSISFYYSLLNTLFACGSSFLRAREKKPIYFGFLHSIENGEQDSRWFFFCKSWSFTSTNESLKSLRWQSIVSSMVWVTFRINGLIRWNSHHNKSLI